MHLTPGQRDFALTVLRAHAAETNLQLRITRERFGPAHHQVGQLAEQARLAAGTVAAIQADSPAAAAA